MSVIMKWNNHSIVGINEVDFFWRMAMVSPEVCTEC